MGGWLVMVWGRWGWVALRWVELGWEGGVGIGWGWGVGGWGLVGRVVVKWVVG